MISADDDLEQLLARKRAITEAIAADSRRAERLQRLRTWQSMRLARTYADLGREPRHAAAVRFFLTDLYGPQDFTHRDDELRRASRYLKRGLPASSLQVLERAVALDVVSAELDLAMAEALGEGTLTAATYAEAYRRVGRPGERRRQIELLLAIGEELDRIVRRPWIGMALRAAHAPAHAMGFGALQGFLERGMGAFRQLAGTATLFGAIRQRETRLMEALLRGDPAPLDETFERAP
jgi:hypothetical protein